MSPTATKATVRATVKAAATTNGKVTASPVVKIEMVTPKKAQEWLEGNVDNRKLRESRVLYLARTMQLGEWELTGDAIVFDSEGVLINGQHRLTAVVVAGVPAQFLILRGVPSTAQEVMDQGLSRNLADQLHRRGVKYTTWVSQACRVLFWLRYIEDTGNVHYAEPSMRPSLRELLQLFEANTELEEEAKSLNVLISRTRVRSGTTLGIKHRLLQIDAKDTEIFFDLWAEGEGLKKSDPVYRLREFTLQDSRFRTTKGRAPEYRYMAYVFKAWNAWREGMPINKLTWQYSSTKKEPWPNPI